MAEGAAKRIKHCRERGGLDHATMAAALQMSVAGYWDLESYDDEISDCINLGKALELARLLKASLLDLLEGATHPKMDRTMSFEMLRDLIQQKIDAGLIHREGLSWEIDRFLNSPETGFEEPLMFLEELAPEVSFDWREVVAHYSSGQPQGE
jgi:hypothetical protein